MSDDEIFRVFNTHRHDVPEYEIASIKYGENARTKRSVTDNRVSFKAFGEKVELFLEPNNHVLYGSATPIYIASFDGKKFKYERKPFVSQRVEILNRIMNISKLHFSTAFPKKYEKLHR